MHHRTTDVADFTFTYHKLCLSLRQPLSVSVVFCRTGEMLAEDTNSFKHFCLKYVDYSVSLFAGCGVLLTTALKKMVNLKMRSLGASSVVGQLAN